MYKTCVIGAGAAGLIAAIEASTDRNETIIIDKNKKAGMKLYATGNGRCNLANMHMASSCYYGNSFATDILGEDPSLFVTEYMNDLGIKCYDKNGYIYPRSNQASSVVWALLDRLRKNSVTLKLGAEVGEIIESPDHYSVTDTNGNEICKAENVILALGGYSSPKLGAASESVTKHIFDSLKISVTPHKPALCPVICSPDTINKYDINDISGVRSNSRVTVKLKDGKEISEYGEVQFTDYGLSGIVIFDLSYYDDIDKIFLNVMTDIEKDCFIKDFLLQKNNCPGRTLLGFLNGYINDKLAAFIISSFCRLDTKQKLAETDVSVAETIYDKAVRLSFSYSSLYGYTHSQVTKGGISCENIEPETMSLKNRRGLFAVGEAVDVCGKCGGYNLMWAFRTGYIAGRSVINI